MIYPEVGNFTSLSQMSIVDLCLSEKEQLKVNKFLYWKRRETRETKMTLASVILDSKQIWSENELDGVLKNDRLKKIGLSREDLTKEEKMNLRIADFLADWIYDTDNLERKLTKRDLRRIDKLTINYYEYGIFSRVRTRLNDLGLVAGLREIGLYELEANKLNCRFCEKEVKQNKKLVIFKANYISSGKRYPIFTVFGINRDYFDQSDHIEIPDLFRERLDSDAWRRYSDNRRNFYYGRIL